MQLTATQNFVVRSNQAPTAPAQPGPAPEAPPSDPTEVFQPTTPAPKEEGPKKPMWHRVLLHTAWGAATGAVYGGWMNDSFSRNIGINVAIGAGAGGVLCGGIGAGLGAFNNEAGKGFLWGAGIGAVGGGVIGLVGGSIDHLIRSAMPFSPTVNGAILGGISGALSTPAESLFDQLKKAKEADKK